MSIEHLLAQSESRHRRRIVFLVCSIAFLIHSGAQGAVNPTPASQGILECTTNRVKKHNPGLAGKPDRLLCFEAYVSNFNTSAATTTRGKPKYWAVPHWVAHHIERAPEPPETKERPPSWFTVPDLQQQGIAPTDDSYKFSEAFRKRHQNWYERGHLAQKYLAERLGGTAGWFTHNVANAVPQRSQFNKGPWLTLECYTGAWANKYGEVWVVTGPVFKKRRPITWLRSDSQKKALPVATPVALFKIVLRKDTNDRWDALAFLYPQTHKTYRKGPFDPAVWFKSIREIERLTGEEFLTNFAEADQLKQQEASKLWPVAATDFDPGCKNQKANVR